MFHTMQPEELRLMYLVHERAKIKKLRSESAQQKLLWDVVNYPNALYIRIKQRQAEAINDKHL